MKKSCFLSVLLPFFIYLDFGNWNKEVLFGFAHKTHYLQCNLLTIRLLK